MRNGWSWTLLWFLISLHYIFEDSYCCYTWVLVLVSLVISFSAISFPSGQLCHHPRTSEANVKNMGKWIQWIHRERLFVILTKQSAWNNAHILCALCLIYVYMAVHILLAFQHHHLSMVRLCSVVVADILCISSHNILLYKIWLYRTHSRVIELILPISVLLFLALVLHMHTAKSAISTNISRGRYRHMAQKMSRHDKTT